MGERVKGLYDEFKISDEDRDITIDTTNMTVLEVVDTIENKTVIE